MTPPASRPHAAAAQNQVVNGDERRWLASIIIGLFCLIVYNANLRSISAGDDYPARYLPFAILQHGTIFLNPVATVAAQGRADLAYWMLPRPDGHIMSMYPVELPLLVAPLYFPAIVYLHVRGATDARLDQVALVMEKLVASLLASLSVSLLFLLLQRRTTMRTALLLTIAYAFGTTTWVISSQALWQHGIAQVLVIGALLVLTAPCTVKRTLAAGLLLGLIAGNRPPDALIAAALGVYGLFWAGRRRGVVLVASSALPMAVVLFYNLHAAGNIGGGYGLIGKSTFFDHDLFPGLAGLLVSPTRGLLLFSPFLLFLILAWRYRPGDPDERRLTWTMTAAVAIQLLVYAKADWRGGLSWGPRYLTDVLPLLIWMLVPVVTALRGAWRLCFLLTVAIAICIQMIGAFCYTSPVDMPIFAADHGFDDHDMGPAWVWRNSPVARSLKQGLAPAELTVVINGSFDAIESGGRATTVVYQGDDASVAGWALAGDGTPLQVAVMVDGRQTIVTGVFFDRPDVRRTLHETELAGWRIPLPTASLSPGVHRLTAFVWATGKNDGHFLQERTLTVRPATRAIETSPGVLDQQAEQEPISPDLIRDAETAAARIREHQQSAGYWLTSYTSEARFREPRVEMNTFLTALLVDLLNPLAGSAGLEESLLRARQHLTNQIEPNGLVRYHGLPNGPGIGTLGCVITPDTDNTALVWRIAPAADRERLATALAIIERYRTSDGLFRTWLAPRNAYQCLDPGSDPDPADIGIQMHLLMLLSEVRPAAAQALCNALRPVVDQDRVWVYYRNAPVIPTLRLTDLRRAGCTLELPESRMRSDVSGQQIWESVAQFLADGTGSPRADRTIVRAVLRELARDDFAFIKKNPPLLYHNDISATVPRYYWSVDAGYALWLRLRSQYDRRDPRFHN